MKRPGKIKQILLPVLKDPKIRITLEYSEKEKQAEIRTVYNGESFDPADTENMLSYKLLQGTAKELVYSAEKGKDYTNTFICRITE